MSKQQHNLKGWNTGQRKRHERKSQRVKKEPDSLYSRRETIFKKRDSFQERNYMIRMSLLTEEFYSGYGDARQ